jgi:hypothetical protein
MTAKAFDSRPGVRVRGLLFLFLAFSGGVAGAAPTPVTQRLPPDSPAPPSVARIDAETAAYGAWLHAVNRIVAELHADFDAVRESWGPIIRGGPDARVTIARARAQIARLLSRIDEANARLAALDAPDIGSLPFPDDLLPPNLTREMIALHRGLRGAIEGFNTLFEAIERSDLSASAAAYTRIMRSMRLVYEGQVVLTRASLASTARDQSPWNVINVRLLFLRAMTRLIAAWPDDLRMSRDPSLSADLLAIAAELEATATEGGTRIETELLGYAAEAERAERDGNADTIRLMRRLNAVLTAVRDAFPLARDLAAALRAGAATAANGTIRIEALGQAVRSIMPLKARFDAIALRESAALAGQQ